MLDDALDHVGHLERDPSDLQAPRGRDHVGQTGARSCEKAVKTPLTDAQLLLFGAVVRHRIHGLDAYLLSAGGEGRALIAAEEMARERQEMETLLLRARAAFAKLNVPKRHLDERWGVLGGPERELGRFVEFTTPLHSALSERGLLPAYLPDTPFVADLRIGESGAIEAEWAWLTKAEA